MTLCHVVGTRPQNIKGSVISKSIALAGHKEVIYNTFQHYDSSLNQLPDAPRVGDFRLPELYGEIPFDYVVVEGDTRTTLMAAIWAKRFSIPVIHVEAGCRTYEDMPEEHIRHAVDHMAQYHLCAHASHVDNLKKEGIYGAKVVGDIQIWLAQNFRSDVHAREQPIDLLLSIHREANATQSFVHDVLEIIRQQNRRVFFPAHPRIHKICGGKTQGLSDPVSHQQLLYAITRSRVVVTDSGGIQKEAAALGKPVIVLRAKTEWPMLRPFLCPDIDMLPELLEAAEGQTRQDLTAQEFPQNPEEELTKFFKNL